MKRNIDVDGLPFMKAKSAYNNLWYCGTICETVSGKFCIKFGQVLEEAISETACIYCGYVDKDNKPIFDKDIITIDGSTEQYVVIYYDDKNIDVITLDEYKKGYELVSFNLSAISDTCKVIGNLYD